MNRKAILDGTEVKEIVDLKAWAAWFETATESGKRQVGDDRNERMRISTVFLGLDHGYRDGRALWFETCVFDVKDPTKSKVVERYCTWELAELGHEHWVVHYLGEK
jgi:hypothetical protein